MRSFAAPYRSPHPRASLRVFRELELHALCLGVQSADAHLGDLKGLEGSQPATESRNEDRSARPGVEQGRNVPASETAVHLAARQEEDRPGEAVTAQVRRLRHLQVAPTIRLRSERPVERSAMCGAAPIVSAIGADENQGLLERWAHPPSFQKGGDPGAEVRERNLGDSKGPSPGSQPDELRPVGRRAGTPLKHPERDLPSGPFFAAYQALEIRGEPLGAHRLLRVPERLRPRDGDERVRLSRGTRERFPLQARRLATRFHGGGLGNMLYRNRR